MGKLSVFGSFILGILLTSASHPQTKPIPLGRTDILGRQASGEPPSYIAFVVASRGIRFTPDDYFLALVKRSGGDGILIERLSSARPDNALESSDDSDVRYEHLAKCGELLQTGDLHEAESECRQAAVDNPLSAYPLVATIRCLADDSDNTKEADELWRKADELAPGNSQVIRALAYLPSNSQISGAVKTGQVEPETLAAAKEEALFLTANQQDPLAQAEVRTDLAAAHSRKAQELSGKGKKELAEREILTAIRLEPGNPQWHSDLADLYRDMGDVKKEVEQWAQAIRVSPKSRQWHEWRVNAFWSRDQYDLGIQAGEEALALFPDHSMVLIRTVEMLSKQGRGTESIKILRNFLDASANQPKQEGFRSFAQRQLGDELLESGEFEAAASIYEEILRTEPNDARVVNALGYLAMELGHLDVAMDAFRRASALEPKFAQSRINLALAFMRRRNTAEALDQARLALEIDPENSTAHLALAEALDLNGESKSAAAEYERALTANPDNPEEENNLAWIMATSGNESVANRENALKHAKHALQLLSAKSEPHQQQSANFLDTLAEAQFVNGNLPDAIKAEEGALKLMPAQPEFTKRLNRFRSIKTQAQN